MWKRILPWVVSLGLLAYLAFTHDVERAWAAFQRVSFGWLALVAILGTLVCFLYDTFCLTLLLRRFNAPVTFGEMLPLKGSSYLLNIINYNAAMGGMALYLKRVRQVSFLESASSLLFMNVIDVFVLAGMIGAGLLLSGDTLDAVLSAETRQYLLYVLLAIAGILLGCWIYWNAGFDFLVLGRLRKWSIFHAFREARVRDYAWLAALRSVMVFLYVVITWLFARLFEVEVPLASMMALQPIIIFVGTIPISIAGLGTTQVVMIAAYGPFAAYLAAAGPAAQLIPTAADAAAIAGPAAGLGAELMEQAVHAAYFDPAALILAMSTAAISSVVLVRVLIGTLYLNQVSKRLESPS